MRKDLRETALYQEAEALHRTLRQPGTGHISLATDLSVSGDGRHAVYSGALMDRLEGTPATRICRTDLTSGETRVLTFGPNTDQQPKFAPDASCVAFLSDRHRSGDFQLYLLDPQSGSVRFTPAVSGWVEYLHWSPDGRRILLGVAGHGADISGGQGATTSKQVAAQTASWMPSVDTGDESFRWRSLWVFDVASDTVRRVSPDNLNVWEATWCGNEAIAAIVSAGPSEGLWYSAGLARLDLNGGVRELYTPKDQLGWPAASPSGGTLAVVEALCSDRWIVAGDLLLFDSTSGRRMQIDTRGTDITYTEWRSDRYLLVAGHRGFDAVVGLWDHEQQHYRELWSSQEISVGGRYIHACGFGANPATFAMVAEGFARAPEIAVIEEGRYRTVKSFDPGYAATVREMVTVEAIDWQAPDGLRIEGWLLRPARARGAGPLIMSVHGGPVGHSRPMWLGRSVHWCMLLSRGYSVFFPNPRGSSGRGQDFARHVCGDLGGADTYDLLSGVDALVARGIADAQRLGVMGVSYGGFMTAWLITQDNRFAAAVPVAPHSNQVTEHLLSNIPHFCELFLADKYNNPGGRYFQRSPIMHAQNVRTPALTICGALDRCTPAEEGMQFHSALLENGAKSVLVTYPEEGHGIRVYPAIIDFAARVVAWFEEHMPCV